MIEKNIYNSWAFGENENEKCKTNREIYNELKDKSKCFYRDEQPSETELNELMCYRWMGAGYAHSKYKILSNPHNFTTLEQALICDAGNLCFGYRNENGFIVIHTD